MSSNFKPFYWESNQCWGTVDSLEQWHWMLKRLLKANYLKASITGAKCLSSQESSEKPCFGLYNEYTGSLTLGEWAQTNNIDLFEGFNYP